MCELFAMSVMIFKKSDASNLVNFGDNLHYDTIKAINMGLLPQLILCRWMIHQI